MRLVDECPLRDEGDEASKRAVEESLWPSLSTRLVTLSSPRSDRFNGWIPAVTVAAVCLAMVLIASPPQMLSPQEAPAYSATDGESWPASQATSAMRFSSPLPRWQDRPIPTQPVDTRNQPGISRPHPIEEMLDSHPAFSELNGPIEFFLEKSHPSGPILVIPIE